MSQDENRHGIVPTGPRGLSIRSLSLVRRGLGDLLQMARDTTPNEDSAEAWTDRGLTLALPAFERPYLKGGAHNLEALECYEKALTIDPRYFRAWLWKGYSLDELGRWHEAIQAYDKAIEIDPSHCVSWLRKAEALYNLGHFEDARRYFDFALQLSSTENVSKWMERGLALQRLGRYEEALRCYDRVLNMEFPAGSPYGKAFAHSCAWNAKADNLSLMGRRLEAVECYDKSIALDYRHVTPWWNKAHTLGIMKKFDDAIRCCDRGIELFPECAANWWSHKGVILQDCGRLEEALVCHERALSSNPPEILGWYNKAIIQEQLGRAQDAIKSYEAYLAFGPPAKDASPAAIGVNYARERLQNLRSRTK